MTKDYPIEIEGFIEIVPSKRSSKPYIKGSRIAVNDILGMLSDSMSHEEIIAYFPTLTEDHIAACLTYREKNGLVRE